MGTNYYLVKGEHPPEVHYDHPLNGFLKWGTGKPPMIHIGKSSGGWCFALHIYPELGINTLADWQVFASRLLSEGWRIENEYGEHHTLDGLWDIVKREGWDELSSKYPFRRHDIAYGHCVGHGEGFYDYIVGDFS